MKCVQFSYKAALEKQWCHHSAQFSSFPILSVQSMIFLNIWCPQAQSGD